MLRLYTRPTQVIFYLDDEDHKAIYTSNGTKTTKQMVTVLHFQIDCCYHHQRLCCVCVESIYLSFNVSMQGINYEFIRNFILRRNYVLHYKYHINNTSK